jgi:hypothetical protein
MLHITIVYLKQMIILLQTSQLVLTFLQLLAEAAEDSRQAAEQADLLFQTQNQFQQVHIQW